MANNREHTEDFLFNDDDDHIFEDSFFYNLEKAANETAEVNINKRKVNNAFNVSELSCDEEISGFDKIMGRTWIYPTNYPVRDYQFNIIKAAILKNTLVSLPTGLGKTFIAAVIMYNFYRWYPTGKIIFIAPTRHLVSQQMEACYNICAIPRSDTIEMTGRMHFRKRIKNWSDKRVFFVTPQILYNDIRSGICPGDKIRCLVFDEAHKAQGKYPYCKIISTLTEKKCETYRVLALSATPGNKIANVVKILQNLRIAHLEIRSENCIDVAPYSHSRKIDTVIVPLGPELSNLRERYFKILDVYARKLKENNILSNDISNMNKGKLVMIYKDYLVKCADYPQRNSIIKDFVRLIRLFHGYELLTKHGTRIFLDFFDDHPESWMKLDDQLTGFLERLRCDLGLDTASLNTSILSKMPEGLQFGHPKFDKLKEIMINHFQTAKERGVDTRAIVYCEYRGCVNLVNCLLLQCRPLIMPQEFVGLGASGKGGKIVNSSKNQLRVMANFRAGLCNTLVATCVGEEGLDVGSVDLIVCFDVTTKSPIRLVQRCGRTGRERGGQVYILVTEGKEHQTLLDSKRQRDYLSKKILQSKEIEANLCKINPRMVPQDYMPQCQMMYITATKSVEENINSNAKKDQKGTQVVLSDKNTTAELNKTQFDALYPEECHESSHFQYKKDYSNLKAKSPIKKKKTKKKKGIPSPNKRDGDVRALFSTAVKSNKNYTNILKELGLQNQKSVPTSKIDMIVELNMDKSKNKSPCKSCDAIIDSKALEIFRKHNPEQQKPLTFLTSPILPDVNLLYKVDTNTIYDFVSNNKVTIDSQELGNDYLRTIECCSLEESKNNCVDDNIETQHFDFDVEDIFDIGSPEEANIAEEVNSKKTNDTLNYFGLVSIDDIFADDDSDNSVQFVSETRITEGNNNQNDIYVGPPSPSLLSGPYKETYVKSPIIPIKKPVNYNILKDSDNEKNKPIHNMSQASNESMFPITQLAEMIYKTKEDSKPDNNPVIEGINYLERARSISPILFTQADRTRASNINNTSNAEDSKTISESDSDGTDDYDFRHEITEISAIFKSGVNVQQEDKQKSSYFNENSKPINNDEQSLQNKIKNILSLNNNKINDIDKTVNLGSPLRSPLKENISPVKPKNQANIETACRVKCLTDIQKLKKVSNFNSEKPSLNNTNDHQEKYVGKNATKKPITNERKKKKNDYFFDLEAAVDKTGVSSDELSDETQGSIRDFICDDNLSQEDILSIYLQINNQNQVPDFKMPMPRLISGNESDDYERDSFCVDSNTLTIDNSLSELEIAELKLKNMRRKKRKRKRVLSIRDEAPNFVSKRRKRLRLSSDSESG